jgi:hypothetical protein
MSESKGLRALVHEAVEKGATSAEDIHRSIAALPLNLKVLDEVGIFPEVTKEVGRIQDRSIGAVYDLVRRINERIDEVTTDILRSARPRRKSQ